VAPKTSPTKATIKIGDTEYTVDLSKIPYLSTWVNDQGGSKAETHKDLAHGPIPLFDIALKGIESGYRQCFRLLPPDLTQHQTLCETFKLLEIDVQGGLSIEEMINNIKANKKSNQDEDEYYSSNKSGKQLARDSAFQLLYVMLMNKLGDEQKYKQKLYDAVLFVIGHLRTFGFRTRRVLRAAYERKFVLTVKQRANMDKWDKGGVDDEDDVTTEEEPSFEYDSDFSF
jgi:hypothetical protein